MFFVKLGKSIKTKFQHRSETELRNILTCALKLKIMITPQKPQEPFETMTGNVIESFKCYTSCQWKDYPKKLKKSQCLLIKQPLSQSFLLRLHYFTVANFLWNNCIIKCENKQLPVKSLKRKVFDRIYKTTEISDCVKKCKVWTW